jgi:hypothetical protein
MVPVDKAHDGPDGRLNLAGAVAIEKTPERSHGLQTIVRHCPRKLQIGQSTRHPESHRTACESIVPGEAVVEV